MAMDIFFQQLLNGLVLGSLYALIALGYTMVYGILQLINFTHGEVLMLGALMGLSLSQWLAPLQPSLGPGLFLALVILGSMPLSVLAALLIERLAYRPLRHAPRLAPLISAIGLSIVLQITASLVWGPNPQVFPDLLPTEPWQIWGAYLAPKQLLILVSAGVLMAGLLGLIQFSPLGRAMRAVAEHPQAAQLMGISPNRVIALTFALGAGLAAIAGVLLALNYNTAHFTMGFTPGLKAFTAAVLGGIGNVPGAMLGGLLLGVLESLGAGYLEDLTGGLLGSHYQDIFAFGVLILILLLRPSGLLGERLGDRP